MAKGVGKGRTARCGTPSGFTRHQRDGEPPCDACKKAKREYDKERRSAGPNQLRNRQHAMAQRIATSKLREKYRSDYQQFYREAKEEIGMVNDDGQVVG